MRLRFVVASAAVLVGIAVPVASHASVVPGADGPSNIIGGSTVTSAPWAAAILSNGQFVCSGSIISPNYVLTATHCLGGTMSVRVGSVNRSSGGTTSQVASTASRFDLALLRLSTPISTTYVRLASANPPVGATNTIFGWGMTCNTGCSASPVLKTASVQVTTNNARDNGGGQAIQSNAGSGAAWRGDSGGPQFYNGAQVGVASLADGGSMQIYGSVAANRAWITQVSGV